MKQFATSAIAAVALFAAASVLWPHAASTEHQRVTAGMPSLAELHIAAGSSKLAADDFDDRSLVFSRQH